MKKYNLSKPRKYTDSQGNEKTYWDKVGELIEFEKKDGTISRIVKIPAIGLEANVFEEKPREEAKPQPKVDVAEKEYNEYPTEEVVNTDDIPF